MNRKFSIQFTFSSWTWTELRSNFSPRNMNWMHSLGKTMSNSMDILNNFDKKVDRKKFHKLWWWPSWQNITILDGIRYLIEILKKSQYNIIICNIFPPNEIQLHTVSKTFLQNFIMSTYHTLIQIVVGRTIYLYTIRLWRNFFYELKLTWADTNYEVIELLPSDIRIHNDR